MKPLPLTSQSTIYHQKVFKDWFQRNYELIICQDIKEAKRNFYKQENFKEQLLEITIDFFFQFQPPFTKFQHNYKLILQYTTTFITS
jgi:hypothetical protein